MKQETVAVLAASEPQEAGKPRGAERVIRSVRKMNQKRYTADEKIRIVVEGLRKELTAAELCRREGLSIQTYYTCVKGFMEGGTERLKGDTKRSANREEVEELKRENQRLKDIVKYIILLYLIILYQSLLFGQEKALSLDDCLKIAYKNNPDLHMQKTKVEEQRFKYYGHRGMLFPQIDASITYLRYGEQLPSKKALFGDSLDDYYSDVSIKQVLFSGGKYYSLTQSARLAFEAEQQKLALATRAVVLAVKKAYYELARSEYAVKVQTELLDKLKEQSNIAQLLYNSGKTSSLDVLKIQTQVASSEDTLNSLKNSVHTRSLLLGQVMGINEPVIIEDTSPQAKENIILSTQCLSNKFKDNPELKYVVTSVDRTGYDISAARSELMPSLVLKVNYNFEDKGFFPGNPNWFAGAGISLPLFHGGSIFAQIGQAKARQKQAIDAVRQTEISLRVKFESAIATAADKSRRLKTTKKVLELSKEALNLAELKYNTGKLSALDLIDAQTVWYNAMLTYENNTIDYLITLSEIEYICPQAIAEEAH